MTKIRFYCPRYINFFSTILLKGHNTKLLGSFFDADSEYIYEGSENGQNCPKNDLEILKNDKNENFDRITGKKPTCPKFPILKF